MQVTVEIDPARRTAAFREVSYLAAGDSCRVVLDGVRGADFGSLALLLYRDAASESPVASCSPFSPVAGHPALADGELALDTAEMAAWFADAVPEESDDSDDSALPRASASAEPRLAARASLAERSVRADGWLVVLDRDRTWAACRVPVLLRPGAGGSGTVDPTSIRALVEGLVSAALAGKADKVPSASASAGNLASLDASGNLADSGATPASIKAAAVAEVVANAPGTMDTLKEIADILGSSQQSGTVLKRIADLESAEVPVDATLSRAGEAADAKAVGDALRSGFTEWEFSGEGVQSGVVYTINIGPTALGEYRYILDGTDGTYEESGIDYPTDDEILIYFSSSRITATRHLVTPTKTSQLANDGDGTNAFVRTNDTRLSDARTPTAHHATHAANGSDPIAPADIGAAAASDLPYRLVTIGEWVTSNPDYAVVEADEPEAGAWWSLIAIEGESTVGNASGNADSTSLTFVFGPDDTVVTATRSFALLDRAGNRVVVSGDTTLALPAAVAGYCRDFLVRLEISGSTVPTITFQGQGSEAPNGADEITYETDGDEFPVPDEAGTWSYSFTENCVAHKFAVSLKKVNVVAQGGS